MPAAKIVALVFDSRYEEAGSILCAERKSLAKGESHRLTALSEALQEKIGQLGKSDASMRRILSALHMLANGLMNQEYWSDAEIVIDELLRLSLAENESYFFDDALFRRAVCLKALGRIDEFERARAEIPAGTEILMGDGFWRADDI